MNRTLELIIPAKQSTAKEPPTDVDALDTAKPLNEIFQPFQSVMDKWEAKAAALNHASRNCD